MNAIKHLGCIRSQEACVILLQALEFLARYKIQDLVVILFQAFEFLSPYKVQDLSMVAKNVKVSLFFGFQIPYYG